MKTRFDLVRARLVFLDWQERGQSVYNTEIGVQLSLGSFHSGTTFCATLSLDADDAADLRDAVVKGYRPVFELMLDESDKAGMGGGQV